MEVPGVAEFEVYMDIDGAVEEDEDSVQSENGDDRVIPVATGEQSVRLPRQDPGTDRKNSPSKGSSSTPSLAQEGVSAAPSTSGHAMQGHDSDNEEVDVDTPFDGKLFGQTHLTQAKKAPSMSNQHNLLSKLLSFTASSSSAGVSEGPAIPKKPAVARKSTTKQPMSVVSNVAKKSTSKQSQHTVNNFRAKATSNKAKTGNILQVKFGHEKYLAKAKAHANFKSMCKASSAITKKPAQLVKKAVQGMPKFAARTVSPALPTVSSNAGRKMFPCMERSGDRIACPECDVVVKTYCLRSHLKTVHNLPMKNCKKCKITFTDLNLYSEHYAHHLQEKEDSSDTYTPKPRITVPLPLGFQAKRPTKRKSAVTSDTCDDDPRSFREVPSVSDERNFHQDYPESLQIPPSAKKRKLSSFPPGPLLGQELQPDSITFPNFPKLPPKPRKPSFQSKKKRSFFSGANRADSLEESNTLTLPAMPKLPAKPRRPFSSSKMRALYTPGSSDNKRFLSESVESASSRGRSSSSESLQSEELSSSGSSAIISTPYNESRKTAVRRQMPVSSPQGLPSSKKAHLYTDAGTRITRKYCGRATVSLVSLETASRPYDCKKCLAAFHVALQCPRSFRQYSQGKPYTSLTEFAQREQQHSHHQDTVYGSVKIEIEDDSASPNTSLRHHRAPCSPYDQEEDVPAKGHGKGQLFQCQKCKESFQYRSVLLRHLAYHSWQYSCGVCKKAFKQKVDLLDHLQIMHDGRMFLRCKYCERKFQDMAEFESHMTNHKDGTVVPCTVCNKQFSNSKQMHVHMTVQHGVAQNCVVCRACGKRFKNTKVLSIHLRVTHKSRLSSQCTVCGRKFKQPKYLTLHMKMAHGTNNPGVTKIRSCRVCQKVFHNNAGLAAHFKLRHGVSLAVAMSEDSIFSDPSPAPEPASQPKSEGPSTDDQQETSKPVTTDGKTLSLTCQICGKSYSKRKVVVAHYRNIHNMEPPGMENNALKCQMCDKLVYSIQGLKVHYRVRHRRKAPEPSAAAENPKPAVTSSLKGRFRCGICAKFFSYSWSLVRHQRLYHRRVAKGTLSTKPNPVQPVQTKPNPFQAKPNPVLAKGNSRQTKPNPLQARRGYQYIKSSLKVNPFSNKKKRGWVCPVCAKPFSLRKSMRMHVKADHPKSFKDERFGRRKCPKCKKAFRSKAKMFIHVKTCGLEGKVQKSGLQERVQKKQTVNIKQKMNLTNRAGVYKCMMCEKVFGWKQSLIRHMEVLHRLTKEVILYNLARQSLGQSEKSHPSGLKSERKPSSELKQLCLCEVCNLCFTSDQALSRHIRRRHGGVSDGSQCRYRHCKRLFPRNDVLIEHIRRAHPQMSIYMCISCRCGFDTTSGLFSHSCAGNTHSSTSDSKSWQSQDYFAQGEDFASVSTEQECRYKCMTCDVGFHKAREWTKHMQQHGENPDYFENMPQAEQVTEAPETVRLSIFDVMSSSSIFSCKFCQTIFKDENEMNLHVCTQPVMAQSIPKKGKRKHRSQNFAPVKCTVCLKLFSPLSIKRHMKNIHALPMKICNICNIVFTDLERFRRHDEMHSQHEGGIPEEVAGAESVEDEYNEDAVTFFICQVCGGLFSDTVSLASHACPGSQPELEAHPDYGRQEDVHGRLSETDLSRMSEYSVSHSLSADDTDSYTESVSGSTDITEHQTTLYERARGFDFQPGIVIESVSSLIKVEPDTEECANEVLVNITQEAMETENENLAREQLVPSHGISFQDVMLDSPLETVPSPDTSRVGGPSHIGSENTRPESQEQLQSDTDHVLSTSESTAYDMPETFHRELQSDTDREFPTAESTAYDMPETFHRELQSDTDRELPTAESSAYNMPETFHTDNPEDVEKSAVITGAGDTGMHETTLSDEFAEVSETVACEADSEHGEASQYEEAITESGQNIPYEAENLGVSYTAPCQDTDTFSVNQPCENVSPTKSADSSLGNVGNGETFHRELQSDTDRELPTAESSAYNMPETFHTDNPEDVEKSAVITGAGDTGMHETTLSDEFAEVSETVACEADSEHGEASQYEEAITESGQNIPYEAENLGVSYTAPCEDTDTFSVNQPCENVSPTKSADSSLGNVGNGETFHRELQSDTDRELSTAESTANDMPETFHRELQSDTDRELSTAESTAYDMPETFHTDNPEDVEKSAVITGAEDTGMHETTLSNEFAEVSETVACEADSEHGEASQYEEAITESGQNIPYEAENLGVSYTAPCEDTDTFSVNQPCENLSPTKPADSSLGNVGNGDELGHQQNGQVAESSCEPNCNKYA